MLRTNRGFGPNAVPTSIEQKMMDEMMRRGLPFAYQHRVFGGFYVDFAFPDKKLAVECDGDYWHANPERFPENKLNEINRKNSAIDKKRSKIISLFGWKIVRFWESQINKDVKSCVDQIESILK